MKRKGYVSRSIDLPEWINTELTELAQKHNRTVTGEIKQILESWLMFRDEKVVMALAQACKRFTTNTADALAADEREADRIMDAVQDLREVLANAGYAPR